MSMLKRAKINMPEGGRMMEECCVGKLPASPQESAGEDSVVVRPAAKRQRSQEAANDGQLLTPWEMAHEYAFLVITSGRRTGSLFKLDGPRSVIGRSRRAQVFVDDPLVEGEHASIRCERVAGNARGEFVLRDLDSAHGTYLDGQKVSSMMILEDGDALRVGETELVFKRI